MASERVPQKLELRRVAYWNNKKKKVYVFISNQLALEAEVIALIYKKRWYIETLFRKLKQNLPLKYFLGDNQNTIEIQIWVSYYVNAVVGSHKEACEKEMGIFKYDINGEISFNELHKADIILE
ncbi:Transposase, Sph21_1677 family [hydrothermal vent metagenome]|uniref:Transposase, Sph21_1677 family n=1 Tax=hydrothermal vent metagenome TaxID=652676 RepID=A0A3B0T2D9_9ZZZZ